ncbi:thioredoxin domain-containing protein [Kocuria atrinae]|uniref:DsbA family protein n=1 Tax=Kocuria atrinae TaxID=592377 RepID=UPI000308351D|nr:thioredoxin domain-containing protein [Kocuria atrinae]
MASQKNTAGSSTADQARERARQIADREARKSNGKSKGLIAGIIALLLVIGLIIALVIWQNNKNTIPEAGPVPASANQYGGIQLNESQILQDTSDVDERDINDVPERPETVDESKTPPGIVNANEAKDNGEPVQLVVFQDFECVHCAEFEAENADLIKEKVLSGDVTLENRNLNFLDSGSPDAYSSRASNAAYLVAEQVDPEQYLDFTKEIFSHQGSGGLSNDEIAEIASKHGANVTAEQLDENTYRPMVNLMAQESVANGIAGTPTIFVDGERYAQGDFEKALNDAIEAKN